MSKSPYKAKTLRATFLRHALWDLLHPDVIPLVMSYEVTIQFILQRSCGEVHQKRDKEMNMPNAISLHEHDLVVVDYGRHRIQIFDQDTGRFLRQWGHVGRKEGELQCPTVVAVTHSTPQDQELEAEIFVADFYHISVFRYWDSKFLRRFEISDQGDSTVPYGIAVGWDLVFVSRSWPNQIDVMRQLDGKCLQTIGQWSLKLSPGKLFMAEPEKELWVADPQQHRVVVFDVISGEILRSYGDDLGRGFPEAVVRHGEDVIVCDPHNDRLQVFHQHSTQMLRTIGNRRSSKGRSATKFYHPCDLGVNDRNELFVCDSLHHRVLVFK